MKCEECIDIGAFSNCKECVEDLQKENALMVNMLKSALPNIECKTKEQDALISFIGEFLEEKSVRQKD